MPKFIIKRKPINVFCCECSDLYAFDPKAENQGRKCDCVCSCDESIGTSEWLEVHQEITEISCEACDCYIKVSLSTWDQERGKYPNYCDFCERVKDAFDCGELPAVQAGNIAEIALYIRDKLALERSK